MENTSPSDGTEGVSVTSLNQTTPPEATAQIAPSATTATDAATTNNVENTTKIAQEAQQEMDTEMSDATAQQPVDTSTTQPTTEGANSDTAPLTTEMPTEAVVHDARHITTPPLAVADSTTDALPALTTPPAMEADVSISDAARVEPGFADISHLQPATVTTTDAPITPGFTPLPADTVATFPVPLAPPRTPPRNFGHLSLNTSLHEEPVVAAPDNISPLQQVMTMTPRKKSAADIMMYGQQAHFMGEDAVIPSPVVNPGALHEFYDFGQQRRRSSAGGIAGLEQLRDRQERGLEFDTGISMDNMNQLMQATEFEGKPTDMVAAYLRLDFECGNTFYIKTRSVLFGRRDAASSNTYTQIGPDGSTVIETRPQKAMGNATQSGLDSLRRDKKKKKKKKGGSEIASGAGTPIRKNSVVLPGGGFQDPYNNPFQQFAAQEEPIIHLPLKSVGGKESDMDLIPMKNISRKHARLSFNGAKQRFEFDIMGKNGAFVNEEYCGPGSTIVLGKSDEEFKVRASFLKTIGVFFLLARIFLFFYYFIEGEKVHVKSQMLIFW